MGVVEQLDVHGMGLGAERRIMICGDEGSGWEGGSEMGMKAVVGLLAVRPRWLRLFQTSGVRVRVQVKETCMRVKEAGVIGYGRGVASAGFWRWVWESQRVVGHESGGGMGTDADGGRRWVHPTAAQDAFGVKRILQRRWTRGEGVLRGKRLRKMRPAVKSVVGREIFCFVLDATAWKQSEEPPRTDGKDLPFGDRKSVVGWWRALGSLDAKEREVGAGALRSSHVVESGDEEHEVAGVVGRGTQALWKTRNGAGRVLARRKLREMPAAIRAAANSEIPEHAVALAGAEHNDMRNGRPEWVSVELLLGQTMGHLDAKNKCSIINFIL
ncbi:hypothetical protein DFP72DRAFT_853840 [Ephemerocybe angulata]|uniref:Uncharacterized protein n=1 Tax=Ephemerocybe angulata TaxID=980116 RepID=A0A8H6HJ62_9AGAR|nr:hypothetical protein DFP72DRAFT_853840 [Tulosesus angulatus]